MKIYDEILYIFGILAMFFLLYSIFKALMQIENILIGFLVLGIIFLYAAIIVNLSGRIK